MSTEVLRHYGFICIVFVNMCFRKVFRAGPRTLECGGASGPDPEQSNTGYDVCGVSRKGGEYERGSPPLI